MLNFIRILSFLFVALLLACEPAEESQKSDIDRQDVCADQLCSGHGSCQAAAELESGFRCVCDAGWEGVDCENLSSDGDDDDDDASPFLGVLLLVNQDGDAAPRPGDSFSFPTCACSALLPCTHCFL